MPFLNPLLRALFESSVLSQALPAQNYVVLLPSTPSLLNSNDLEINRRYTDIVRDDDFLGSHILRVAPAAPGAAKETSNVREGRAKAKTYQTVSGRTVIIKENMVYTNKGFKSLTQAQLLNDLICYSPNDGQQWLLYCISKPLVGIWEPIPIVPATIGMSRETAAAITEASEQTVAKLPKKRDIRTFRDVLENFPMIARQMRPGLDRLFNEFGKELGKPLPPPPSRTSTSESLDGTTRAGSENGSIHTTRSKGDIKLISSAFLDDEEDIMRRALEAAVNNAIDLFQTVDKQQLSLLGATTDLTGPMCERLIEVYVVEQVHETLLFPRLCGIYKAQDSELDRRIRQMDSLDVSQVGIEIENRQAGKIQLLSRLSRGVAVFRKMAIASGPQAMVELLLETQKAVSEVSAVSQGQQKTPDDEEKQAPMTVNADVLVSMLLIVVVRSQVRHLQARLSYMQHFLFIDDVESGEMGYALSTLEAVLTYLSRDAAGLRRAAFRNKNLWEAVKKGNVVLVKSILEDSETIALDHPITEEMGEEVALTRSISSVTSLGSNPGFVDSTDHNSTSTPQNLAHVFPFQTEESDALKGKRGKRVQMVSRTMSISSSVSLGSRTATIRSALSGIEGDVSVESLAQTQDSEGNSILMMAIENHQPGVLQYLLASEHFPPDIVISDVTNDGTTLLSAAMQLGNMDIIDLLLDFVSNSVDARNFTNYLAKTDVRGRTAAHYLFNAPELIPRLSNKVPWRLRDKIGQTPLFAICRSYDHPNYASMVTEALSTARLAQGDEKPLRLDEHTDNKGNTMLHIVNDAHITGQILHYCDSDPNATNDKRFTPLMLASKYGRLDMVRVLFGDPRVDLHIKELRGLTAVELAKDDEVRNRIDDLTLFSNAQAPVIPDPTGRLTTVVRSFFVDDGSTRFIIKSGAPSHPQDPKSTTYTITTCRRSLQDFEHLVSWLTQDHPASYLPSLAPLSLRHPFQIHSKPSRAILYDTQTTLDRFLKTMLAHPTFSTHETLWEFFLVPDMQSDQMSSRAKLKAQVLAESIADDYSPITNLTEVDQLISHSRDMVRRISTTTRNLLRRGHALSQTQADLAEALSISAGNLSTLGPPANHLSNPHIEALTRHAILASTPPESSPLTIFLKTLSSIHTTTQAIQLALQKPSTQITRITTLRTTLSDHRRMLNAQSQPRKFNLPGMEESRLRSMRETENKILKGEESIERLGRELAYTREVVVGELAGWTEWRERVGREMVGAFVRGVVVRERERLRGLERCLAALGRGPVGTGSLRRITAMGRGDGDGDDGGVVVVVEGNDRGAQADAIGGGGLVDASPDGASSAADTPLGDGSART